MKKTIMPCLLLIGPLWLAGCEMNNPFGQSSANTGDYTYSQPAPRTKFDNEPAVTETVVKKDANVHVMEPGHSNVNMPKVHTHHTSPAYQTTHTPVTSNTPSSGPAVPSMAPTAAP
ncbi:MAG: hypothetical protein CMF38_07285 [Legionellaceae bacterium]|nr:hypothetical protein [Legionellaceae bacterium]|tara:strand:- start:3658 stop:4005 length:348 start_codon:yes stop_codon:yes gene_type:complete